MLFWRGRERKDGTWQDPEEVEKFTREALVVSQSTFCIPNSLRSMVDMFILMWNAGKQPWQRTKARKMPSHTRGSWSYAESSGFRKWCSLIRGFRRSIWRWRDISTTQSSLSKFPFKRDFSQHERVGAIFIIFFSNGCTGLHCLWWKWRFFYQQQWKYGQDISWSKVCTQIIFWFYTLQFVQKQFQRPHKLMRICLCALLVFVFKSRWLNHQSISCCKHNFFLFFWFYTQIITSHFKDIWNVLRQCSFLDTPLYADGFGSSLHSL